MVDKNMSIREFARVTKHSPNTISKLIKEGKLQTTEDGKIPKSELRYFLLKEVRSQLSKSKVESSLFIFINVYHINFNKIPYFHWQRQYFVIKYS